MRTLLVITRQPSFTAAMEAVLEAGKFQLISKEDVVEAEFLLGRGAIDAAILDAEPADARALRAIEELKSFAPGCPLLVYAGASKGWEWEEDAYVRGVAHVIGKPVRGRLLNTLLARVLPVHEAKAAPPENKAAMELMLMRPAYEPLRALEALRRFSSVLAHSLDPGALLRNFLLILREVIGVNRAIVFLRKPSGLLGDGPLSHEDRWLRSACAIGLDQGLLQHFALSLGAGIGGALHRQGRILRAHSTEAQASREIAKEFQLLGAQVAIPILDRQSLLGVAVLDERLTGEPFTNEELSLIFHMLEEVGLAVRNSWLHGQIQANHAMVADILGQLGSGCLVIGSNMAVLHANVAARRILLQRDADKAQFEFTDLPQQLGSMVFTVIKSGAAVPSFKHQFPQEPDRWFRVAIFPFAGQNTAHTNAALLTIEDITEHERAARLEVEASNLRLVKAMAEHLAHEIGNSLVPLSTHQQLMKDSMHDPEFQESFSAAIASGVKRISRLASQMSFLARDWERAEFAQHVQISDLIVEAFHEAHTYHPGKKVAQLSFDRAVAPWKIPGDPKALRHAFSEIMLNALQANPEAPAVTVRLAEKRGEPALEVEVRDSGSGFTSEAALRAQEPFYSTRSVGLGIGLTVSRRIIESHRGRIDIPASLKGEAGVVRVSLPLGAV